MGDHILLVLQLDQGDHTLQLHNPSFLAEVSSHAEMAWSYIGTKNQIQKELERPHGSGVTDTCKSPTAENAAWPELALPSLLK